MSVTLLFNSIKEVYLTTLLRRNEMKLEALRSRIAAVTMVEIRIAVIEDEIVLLQSRLEPHDTGHLHTAISVLAHRLVELKKTNNGVVT
jgi:hypothetical protein